ncbi:hypothetical protein Lal_00049390 [Lupinus albus]|nr:hypothetical protein Lal_00049390 [Lupinus albus]
MQRPQIQGTRTDRFQVVGFRAGNRKTLRETLFPTKIYNKIDSKTIEIRQWRKENVESGLGKHIFEPYPFSWKPLTRPRYKLKRPC